MGAALLFHGSVTKTHYDAVMHTTGIMRRRNKSHISYAAGDGRVVGDVRDDRRGVEGARGRDGDAAIPRLVRAGGPVVVGWGRGGGGGVAQSEACDYRWWARYVGG